MITQIFRPTVPEVLNLQGGVLGLTSVIDVFWPHLSVGMWFYAINNVGSTSRPTPNGCHGVEISIWAVCNGTVTQGGVRPNFKSWKWGQLKLKINSEDVRISRCSKWMKCAPLREELESVVKATNFENPKYLLTPDATFSTLAGYIYFGFSK